MSFGWMAQDAQGNVVDGQPIQRPTNMTQALQPNTFQAPGQMPVHIGDMTQFLRTLPYQLLSTQDQQKQFLVNQGASLDANGNIVPPKSGGQDNVSQALFRSMRLDPNNPFTPSDKAYDSGITSHAEKISNYDPTYGTQYGVGYQRLAQGPGGFSFGNVDPRSNPSFSVGGSLQNQGSGGGFLGGLTNVLGRNEGVLNQIGGGLLGAGLGLATGNPLLAAIMAARGASTGQVPTGGSILGSALGNFGINPMVGGQLNQYIQNQQNQQQQRSRQGYQNMMPPQNNLNQVLGNKIYRAL